MGQKMNMGEENEVSGFILCFLPIFITQSLDTWFLIDYSTQNQFA